MLQQLILFRIVTKYDAEMVIITHQVRKKEKCTDRWCSHLFRNYAILLSCVNSKRSKNPSF